MCFVILVLEILIFAFPHHHPKNDHHLNLKIKHIWCWSFDPWVDFNWNLSKCHLIKDSLSICLLQFYSSFYRFFNRSPCILQQPQAIYEGAHICRFNEFSFLCVCAPSSITSHKGLLFFKAWDGNVICVQTGDLLSHLRRLGNVVNPLLKGIAAEWTRGVGINHLPQSKHWITSPTRNPKTTKPDWQQTKINHNFIEYAVTMRQLDVPWPEIACLFLDMYIVLLIPGMN